MKKWFFLSITLLTALIVFSCKENTTNPAETPKQEDDKALLNDEAQKAFKYLNDFRQDPVNFGSAIGLNLNGVAVRDRLIWNDTLAKAAEQKAKDMAYRNYFGHEDPDGYGMNYYINKADYTLIQQFLLSKNQNNFESIAAGSKDGKFTIDLLIIDEGVPSLGHRKHLLGMEDFWASCHDCGIGVAVDTTSTSKYTYYTCILIAKHSF